MAARCFRLRYLLVVLAAAPGCRADANRNPVTAAFAQRPANRLGAAPVVFRFSGERSGAVRVYRLPGLEEVAFRFDTPGLSVATVVGYSDDDDQIYVISTRGVLLALDLATGRSRNVDSGVVAVATGPAGTPYLVHADGGIVAVERRVPAAWPVRLSIPPAVIGAARGLVLAERRTGTVRELVAVSAAQPPIVQPLPDGPVAASPGATWSWSAPIRVSPCWTRRARSSHACCACRSRCSGWHSPPPVIGSMPCPGLK